MGQPIGIKWKSNNQQENDNAALCLHLANYHQDHTNPQPPDCYEITYVFKPYKTKNFRH